MSNMRAKISFVQRSRTTLVTRRMNANAAKVVGDTLASGQMWAMARAPVDTGALKKSIKKHHRTGQRTGTVDVGVDYGVYVERGTRHMRAQPFVGPAFKVAHSSVFRPGVRRLFKP